MPFPHTQLILVSLAVNPPALELVIPHVLLPFVFLPLWGQFIFFYMCLKESGFSKDHTAIISGVLCGVTASPPFFRKGLCQYLGCTFFF